MITAFFVFWIGKEIKKMKKNSGLILILIVVLLVGLFYSADNSGSNNPTIGDGTTDIIVPPGGDDGSTDIIIPPGEDEPTEEVEVELLTLTCVVREQVGQNEYNDVFTFEYKEGMTWGEWLESDYSNNFETLLGTEENMHTNGYLKFVNEKKWILIGTLDSVINPIYTAAMITV